MATTEIKTIFSIDGAQKYTDAIKKINKEQELYRAEMNASAAEMRAVGNAQGELQVKIEGLSKVIAAQKKAVEENQAALEFARKKYGENSSVVAELKLSYDQSREAMARQSEAYQKVSNEIEKNFSISKQLQVQIDKNKSSLSVLNAQLGTGVAEYRRSGDAAGELKFQTENLNEQIKLQKQIVYDSGTALWYQANAAESTGQETNSLRIEYEKARKELGQMEDKLKSTTKELYNNGSSLKTTGDSLTNVGDKIKGAGDKMEKAGSKLTTSFTMPAISAGTTAVKAVMDFDRAWSGVVKTVDATDNTSLEELQTSLRGLVKNELPITAEEMFGVAEAAGRLGISADDMVDFSKTMVKLGQTTTLSAQDAATSLVKFSNTTGMSIQDMDRLGSSIVALGQNSKVMEDQIVDMALGLSEAGAQVNMSESDIVGFSAALADLGIEAETGGSAFSTLLGSMQSAATVGMTSTEIMEKTGRSLADLKKYAEDDVTGFESLANSMGYTAEEFKGFIDSSILLEGFSSVTGKTAAEFQKAFAEDATGALLDFIEGLSKAESQGRTANDVLDEMGITEKGMRDALLKAASASGTFKDAIKLSSSAWKENTSLTKEAKESNQTMESQMQLTMNKVRDAAVVAGTELAPTLLRLAEGIADVATKFSELSPETQDFILKTIAIAAAAGPTLKVVGNMTSVVGSLTEGFGKYITKLAEKQAAEVAATAATNGVSTAISGIGLASGAALPIIAAVGVAIAAVTILSKLSEERLREYHSTLDKANAAGMGMAESITSWTDKLSNANNVLQDISEILTGADQTAAWDGGIAEAHQKILDIAKAAAEETRAYTQEEEENIKRLIDTINVYTDKKIQAVSDSQAILEAKIAYEKEMTEEAAANYLKTSEDLYAQKMVIAQQEYDNAIAIAVKTYGELGTMDKEAENQAIASAQLQRDERIRLAEEERTGVVQSVTEKYIQLNGETISSMELVADANEQYLLSEKEIKNELAGLSEFAKGLIGEELEINKEAAYKKGLLSEEMLATNATALKNLTDAWNLANSNSSLSMVAMIAEAELMGVEIPVKVKEMVNKFIQSFDSLPPTSKEKAREAIQGFLVGMKEKEEDLYPAVAAETNGIIYTMEKTLQINSPSKRTIALGENVSEGLQVGMGNKEGSLVTKALNIANSVVNKLRSPLGFFVNSPSKRTIPIGKSVTEGIEVGAEQMVPDLENQMVEISEAMQAALDKKKINLGMDAISMSNISAQAAAAQGQLSSLQPQGLQQIAATQRGVTYNQYVSIGTVENNRQSDIKQLSEQLGAYQQIQAKGKGA